MPDDPFSGNSSQEYEPTTPLEVAKVRGDTLTVRLLAGQWCAVDALGQVVATRIKLHGQDGLAYLLRSAGINFKVEEPK